jgi:tetratricopeptide (TPR) repeat protein
MRIRMRIKHLTLSLLVIGLTAYALINIVMPRVELNAARQQFELGSPDGKQGILDAIHDPISDKSKWELISQYMIEFGDDSDVMRGFNVYIGPGTSHVSGGESRSTFTWSEKLELVQDYAANAPVDGYVLRAAKQLANYYSSQDQLGKAMDILVQTEARFIGNRMSWQRDELQQKQKRLMELYGEDAGAERIAGNEHVSQVSGTVRRSDGTPIPSAGVFLRHENDVNHNVLDSEPYQILTDKQGRFLFDNVVPGSYQLFLGLDFDQISGWTWPVMNDQWLDIGVDEQLLQDIVLHPLMELKSPVNETIIEKPSIEFVWSDVEGASYYNVNIGIMLENGSVSSLLEANIQDNQYSIMASQLYDTPMGVSFNDVDGHFVADPISLLGFTNSNNRIYWNVEAYDKDGRMITRSNGYRLSDDGVGNLPFFYVRDRSMTAADVLLLDNQHEQALAAYKKEYERNPDDVHSLRMILRLLLKSPEEKLPYLQRMIALNPVESYVAELTHYYYMQHNWSAFMDIYRSNDIEVSSLDSYSRSVYAMVLMRLGQLEEARQQFQLAMDSDPSHRFVGNYIALVLYEDMDLQAAMDIAQRYPQRMFGGTGTNWYGLIARIDKELDNSPDPNMYMEELKMKLGWIVEGNVEQLETWLASNEAGPRALIQAIMDVE